MNTTPSKVAPLTTLEALQRMLDHVERTIARDSASPQLKLFNPDGLRVFTSRRPQRPFPGNAPGPKGAA